MDNFSDAYNLSRAEFINTHEVLFAFFKYFDFSFGAVKNDNQHKNIGLAILGVMFKIYSKLDGDFVAKYFGYYNGKKINRDFGDLEKKIYGEKFENKTLFSVKETNINFPKTYNYKLKEPKRDTEDIIYLKTNFLRLNFDISHHILADTEDVYLNVYTQFFAADEKYYEKIGDVPLIEINNLRVVGFEIIDDGLKESLSVLPEINSLTFQDSKEFTDDHEFYFENVKVVIFEDSLIKIGKNFMKESGHIMRGVSLIKPKRKIEKIVIPSSVKYIGENFMVNCHFLKKITFMASITAISDTFLQTTSVETINIPNSVKKIGDNFMFNCVSLESINLSNNLEDIGNNFLLLCKNLKLIEIPASLKTIGINFMKHCESLETISFSGGLFDIKYGFLIGCKNLKSVDLSHFSFTVIEDHFMYGCSGLEKIYLPDTVIIIKNSFMAQCESLKTLSLPKFTREIGDTFMYKCFKLESLVIPSSLVKVGNNFLDGGCTELKTINFPSLSEIGKSFMPNCIKLESIILPPSIKKIEDFSVRSDYLGFMEGCVNLRSIIIPKMEENIIPINFMKNCHGLKTITFLGPIKNIERNFLVHCKSLEAISITVNEDIKNYFMYGCEALKTFNLTGTVKTIGESFMEDCINLKTATFPKDIRVIQQKFMYACRSLEKIDLPLKLEVADIFFMNSCSSLEIVTLHSSKTKYIQEGRDSKFFAMTYAPPFRNCHNLKIIKIPKKSKKDFKDQFPSTIKIEEY